MGDELDIEQPGALIAYLRDSGRIGADETPAVRVPAGGVSNRTVLVQRPSGEAWVIKQALARLRVKVEWYSDVSRIHREALALRYLPALAPPGAITPLVFEDEARHLLAMQAVPEPHENFKAMLLRGGVDRHHIEQFAALLATIHRRSAEAPAELRRVFQDTSFFESLRLEPYYAYAASQVPQAGDFLHALIADTRQRRLALVHGDYSPKNILVRDGRLVLLDHEVIHWGDPAFDIGFAQTHLLSKARHLQNSRQALIDAARDFVDVYSAVVGPVYWGANMQAMAVRHTLGCLLARVEGRSPLEYLGESSRRSQRASAAALMRNPPATPAELIDLLFTWTFKPDADH
jgi:aminoglycoside phosphotransferase (APT) family kinase protein